MERKDALKELLKFIKDNEDNMEVVRKSYYQDLERGGLCSVFDKVIADANEVPINNGTDWCYHGNSTYFYIYVLLDNNKLLSICEKEDVIHGDFQELHFKLSPNADKMKVVFSKVKYHDQQYYMTIYNEDGSLVSDFTYERLHEHLLDEEAKLSDGPLTNIFKVVECKSIKKRIDGYKASVIR